MTSLKVMTLALAIIVTSLPARAQDPKPVEFTIGAGVTFPNAEVRDHLGDGYNVNVGVVFNVTPVIGIEALYSFNGLGEKRISLPVSPSPNAGVTVPTDFSANMNMQYGTVNLVVRKPTGGVRPYLVTGVGLYYRPIEVTTPGVGFVPPYCNPWWYICSPGAVVPVDNVVGSRSSTDFGMDFGGGIIFSNVFYLEARYHFIWGPTVGGDGVAGGARKANGQFFPITAGVRF